MREQADAAVDALRSQMVTFVQDNPGCTEKELMAGTQGNGAKKHSVFTRLREECLQQTGKGARGEPFRYYVDPPVEG